jgi:20S proteasome subunit beta 2
LNEISRAAFFEFLDFGGLFPLFASLPRPSPTSVRLEFDGATAAREREVDKRRQKKERTDRLLPSRFLSLGAIDPISSQPKKNSTSSASTSFDLPLFLLGRCHHQDGVVLGADTRSTSGSTVADKNCEKIHFIAPNVYCCGAGTAADTENSTGMVSSALALHRFATGRASRVATALQMLKSHLFRHQGHISAALVLGGVDVEGPHLFTVYPHGSTDSLPFATMGSGSLNAMAVFEADYREGMGEEEAVALVARAVRAGIFNDLGSGSNVDVCVIRKKAACAAKEAGAGAAAAAAAAAPEDLVEVDYKRGFEILQGRTYERAHPVVYAKGTTPVVATKVMPLHSAVRVLEGEPAEAMETA